jgi:hypothetical protein
MDLVVCVFVSLIEIYFVLFFVDMLKLIFYLRVKYK